MMSALLYKTQIGASSHLLHFLPVCSCHFSLISSQKHTPPSSLCLPSLHEISVAEVLFRFSFFHFFFITWLLGLYYCVFLVLVVAPSLCKHRQRLLVSLSAVRF